MKTQPAELVGWCHCAGSKYMHYFTRAGRTPLCGAALEPTRRFRPASDNHDSDWAPKCQECDEAHVAMWCAGGPQS